MIQKLAGHRKFDKNNLINVKGKILLFSQIPWYIFRVNPPRLRQLSVNIDFGLEAD